MSASLLRLRARLEAQRNRAKLAEQKAAPKTVEEVAVPKKTLLATLVANEPTREQAVLERTQAEPLGTKQLDKTEVGLAQLNDEQRSAISIATSGNSFCLIGGAGSGKTTTVRELAQELHHSGRIGDLEVSTEKVFQKGKPAIAVLSFTNQAVRNIANAMHDDFKSHCSTFHNAVEYHPDYFEVEVLDDSGNWTGDYKNSMRFVPRYGVEGSKCESLDSAASESAINSDHHHRQVDWHIEQGAGLGEGLLLPHLDYVVVEEAGSVPRELFYTFMSALPNASETTFIFLGDLNQLPPVFDDAILGFMLLALPVVELKTLYRNVGLVTKTAQRLLTGKPIRDKEAQEVLSGSDESGTVLFKPYSKHVDWDVITPSIGKHLKKMVVSGEWDTENSVVLIPQNIKFGQIELNRWIGQGIADRDNLEVHHITFNGQNHYYCVGDKVMYNKRYHRISEIALNTTYTGKKALPPSRHVSRWGVVSPEGEAELFGGMTRKEYENDVDVEQFLDNYSSDKDEDSKVRLQASGIVTLVLDDSELNDSQRLIRASDPTATFGECTASSAGELSALLPVNAMTVHKAQGSEWQNVLLVLHRTHGKMLTRELLYTGMTRARTNLTVWYSGEDKRTPGASSLCRGVMNQALKGITLDEKLNYFRNKLKVEAIKHELEAKRKSA